MEKEIEFSVLKDLTLTRDQIAAGVKADLHRVHVTITEMLRNEDCLNAVVEVFWQKYQTLVATKPTQDVHGS